MRPALALLLALPLLAGCLASPAADPAPSPTQAPAEADPASTPPPDPAALLAPEASPAQEGLLLRSCLQGHWNFPARAEDLAPFAPEGFAIAQSRSGLTTVSVTPSWCASSHAGGAPGPAVTEVWIEVPVIPPEGAEVENASHVVPINGFVSDPALADAYAAWGFPNVRVAAFDDSVEGLDGPLWAGSLGFEVAGASYTWELAARGGSGPWDAYLFVRWIPDGEGGVAGRVHLHRGASESAAAGGVVMLHRGDEAPPVAPGIAHMVRGVDMAMLREAWA